MRFFVVLILVVSVLTGCDAQQQAEFPDTLVVVTRNAPTTWYEDRDGVAGPEFDLATAYADYHKVAVRFEVVDTIDEVLLQLKQGRAHIAAAGLSMTENRLQQGYVFGPEYYKVQQQVVCRRDNGAVPRKVEDLVGKNIEVIASSSYVERLQELSLQIPGLKWTEVSDAGTEQLLEKVWLKQIDCTVADSNIVSINRRYYPELLVAFPLAEDQALAWILAENWKHLSADLEQWLEQIEQNGDLAAIHEKYYGHVDIFDYVDMRQFISRIKTRLPKYREDFVRESKVAGVDWSLLAAQAYQESHWNPHAKSPTGVRGMMMLTLNTAKSVGVKNRLDAKQSIKGGARYLARMIKRVPESVQGENRVWLALAAYNVGFAHLQDARILAEQLGKNPDSWTELKQVLPLLSQKKYYKKLKYGYARGSEPVTYVQRIRDYQQVLLQSLK